MTSTHSARLQPWRACSLCRGSCRQRPSIRCSAAETFLQGTWWAHTGVYVCVCVQVCAGCMLVCMCKSVQVCVLCFLYMWINLAHQLSSTQICTVPKLAHRIGCDTVSTKPWTQNVDAPNLMLNAFLFLSLFCLRHALKRWCSRALLAAAKEVRAGRRPIATTLRSRSLCNTYIAND